MNNDIHRAIKMASMLKKSREAFKKTQDYMAIGLNVSKNTIINWEKGTSRPDIFQLCDWFDLLGVNATTYIFQITSPKEIPDIKPNDDYEVLLNSFIEISKSISDERLRQKIYQEYGPHGSDPDSLDQLFNAYLHLPIEDRTIIANLILNVFNMCEAKNELISTNYPMPNIDTLKNSIHLGTQAAIKGNFGYSTHSSKQF